MEDENTEVADFIKNNPFPDGDKLLEIQVDMARFYARNFGWCSSSWWLWWL